MQLHQVSSEIYSAGAEVSQTFKYQCRRFCTHSLTRPQKWLWSVWEVLRRHLFPDRFPRFISSIEQKAHALSSRPHSSQPWLLIQSSSAPDALTPPSLLHRGRTRLARGKSHLFLAARLLKNLHGQITHIKPRWHDSENYKEGGEGEEEVAPLGRSRSLLMLLQVAN